MPKINRIIGMPPGTYVSNHEIENSMPVLEIRPGTPDISGQTLFRVKEAWGDYSKLCGQHGITFEGGAPLKLAYIADSFPTDSFTNDYGESFIGRIKEAASEGLSQVSQMFGGTSAIETIRIAGEKMTDVEKEGLMGGAARQVGSWTTGLATGTEDLLRDLTAGDTWAGGTGKVLGKIGQIGSRVAAGSRVDYPFLWKNGTFSPSYTVTIRLYNPVPASMASTEKYIISPLGAILCLALPRADQEGMGNTYTWPFIHKIRCPGIFELPSAAITNISVIKGGDQHQISYRQSLGIVDVRIDFISLYQSIIAGDQLPTSERPTLEGYLGVLRSPKPSLKPIRGSSTYTPIGFTETDVSTAVAQLQTRSEKTIPPSSIDTPTDIPKRATTEQTAIAQNITGSGGAYADVVAS